MKKNGITILSIVGAIVVILISFFVSNYNAIIRLEEKVDSEYSNISTQLQRRADLIPNLVNTVQGYVDHEEKVIEEITAAREKISNASTVKELSEADQALTTALNSLNVIVENYPDLKASENFINLQDELSGTENRISVARQDYNEAVKAYNTKIKTLPASAVAGMMGKEQRDYFELSDPSKAETPTVNFGE